MEFLGKLKTNCKMRKKWKVDHQMPKYRILTWFYKDKLEPSKRNLKHSKTEMLWKRKVSIVWFKILKIKTNISRK